jgi:hypothetical protein
MSIPWWVYLMGIVMVGFGVMIHFLPVFLARLEAQDKQRREAAIAKRQDAENRVEE